MPEDLISVIDLAGTLGRGKATIFKVLNRLGIEPTKQRSSASGNQLVAYVTQSEANRVALHIQRAPTNGQSSESAPATNEAEYGVFYLIQLEPSHDPQRFKVGFAVAMEERLRQHRCSAPFATVMQTWPCKHLWEKTAIDSVTQGCERLHTEVFRAESIQSVAARCNQFFALMPLGNGA